MNPTIHDQIDLEKKMVAFGVSRHRAGVNKAQDKARGSDTGSAQKLLKEFVLPVSAAIQEYLKDNHAGYRTKYKGLLKIIDSDTIAYLGLRSVFDFFTLTRPLVSLGSHIGMLIEDEAKFKRFHEKNPDYYETIIKDFHKKGTQNYRHMHRVLTLKAKQHDVQWNSWSNEERLAVGCKVIDFIISATNLIERKEEKILSGKNKHRMRYIIVPTESCLEWVRKFEHYAELLHPDRTPCIIQPDPWVSPEQGGYYTPQLRMRTPLIKVRNKKHTAMFTEDLQPVIDAVNIMQEVPWKINTPVLEVLQEAWKQAIPIGLPQSEPYEVPPSPVQKGIKKEDMNAKQRESFDEWKTEARVIHTMNKERISKCFQVIRVLRMAKEYMKYEKFWYVYYCDFRGRIYSSVFGLSPQGADFAKSLLCFSNGRPLSERGLYWLRIHGANMFGKDKESYSSRVEWVIQNERMIQDVADHPLENRDFWGNADKPWQFLAFCFAYREYLRHGLGILSYLPIALDGSCNGLQNFSAMLRDEVGGKATNLVPSKKPADIYTEVADVCTRRLRESTHELASVWLDFCDREHNGFIPRGLTKRPVMTLPYGSTQQSCREYIYKYMIEDAPLAFDQKIRFKLSVFLTPILWASISEVVIAARKGMDWIQKCASIISKKDKPIYWITPLGFPVYQERKRQESIQIRTEIAGAIQIRINRDTDRIDVQKQRLGASPNFVHSMDASHLMLTLLKAREAGVQDFACIHDDYGTHAEDTDLLQKAIREAFVELYTHHNPMQAFKEINENNIQEELPDMPSIGNLDLNLVLDSPYFFG